MVRPPGLANGDSGGGAVVQRAGKWYLAGVVSIALDGGTLYGFTNINSHLPWVSQVTSMYATKRDTVV